MVSSCKKSPEDKARHRPRRRDRVSRAFLLVGLRGGIFRAKAAERKKKSVAAAYLYKGYIEKADWLRKGLHEYHTRAILENANVSRLLLIATYL